jgi:hypothetical protein
LFVVVLASCFLLIVSAVFLLNYPWLAGDNKPLAKIYFNETTLEITDRIGKSLIPIMDSLCAWEEDYQRQTGNP